MYFTEPSSFKYVIVFPFSSNILSCEVVTALKSYPWFLIASKIVLSSSFTESDVFSSPVLSKLGFKGVFKSSSSKNEKSIVLCAIYL